MNIKKIINLSVIGTVVLGTNLVINSGNIHAACSTYPQCTNYPAQTNVYGKDNYKTITNTYTREQVKKDNTNFGKQVRAAVIKKYGSVNSKKTYKVSYRQHIQYKHIYSYKGWQDHFVAL